MKKAAIDIGTNSTRLLVAEVGTISYQTLARQAKVTRLGEGVNETGHIKLSAMDRTLKAIMLYKGIIDSYGKMPVNIASTSVARDADNIKNFRNLIEKNTGYRINVITPEEEARNAFLGATYALDPEKKYLVIDIGGGSTEMMVGVNRELDQSFSKDIGCVRLYEKFINNDPPPKAELEELQNHVEKVYKESTKELLKNKPDEIIGTAGTVTSLCAIAKDLKVYDPNEVHGSILSIVKVKQIYRMLTEMTVDQRLKLPTMEKGREDVIIAGTAILLKLMELIGTKNIWVSETDILDGLMLNA